MSNLVAALGLVLVLEGCLYALFPDGMKRMMVQVLEMTPASLRTAGLAAAGIGIFIVWMAHG